MNKKSIDIYIKIVNNNLDFNKEIKKEPDYANNRYKF